MKEASRNANEWNEAPHPQTIDMVFRLLLAILLALGSERAARAEDGEWSLLLEPMYLEAYGNDQHVLTIHEINAGSAPPVTGKTPVALETESGLAYRFELQYTRKNWGVGLDFFWFDASQGRPSRTVAAGAPIDEIVFETSNRSFTSDEPNEALFFRVLEDTDIATWTVDLYAIKSLVETSSGGLQLQFGLRNADFDNDYHSAVGIENVAGSLFDASSNYGRMIGPLVGLIGDVHFGKHSIRGYFGQSVVLGSAELLVNMTSDFVGPFSDAPTIVSEEFFGKDEDVVIPITEFRINWLYPISRRVSLGVSANTSVWWDLPVPPGVMPSGGGDQVFHENTLVYFGLALAVKLRI
jgi:hypothetical protein